LPKKWIILILILIVIPLAASACSPPDSDEDGRGGPCESIEPAVEEWLDDNLDDISEVIGELVTLDLPIARDIVAEAAKRALLSHLEREIVKAEPSQDKRECIARVRLTFPLTIDLPLISLDRKVQVDYVLRIQGNSVMDSDIDLDSFHM